MMVTYPRFFLVTWSYTSGSALTSLEVIYQTP
ncbi:hypothetical protein COSMO_172 [Mycobacterium phage Cosmo]|uniref:Uncharacterized protein n=1 Tax=Mycobacterium phage Cosmo TaxID=1567467 RepID=A0A0B5A338_9CAUD|nr:hypothetical protein COSMO_172 [Mycobacterium phage Cosmo]